MALENQLDITYFGDFAREEERISKKRHWTFIESGMLDKLETGTISALKAIHKYHFNEFYDFACKLRTVNPAKGNFRFAP